MFTILSIIVVFLLFILYIKIKNWNKKRHLKKLKITMYGDENCPFTVKMKNELKSNNVFHYIRYVDVTDKDGKIEFEKHKFEGIPVIYSKLTKKSSVGYFPYSKCLVNVDNKINLKNQM